MSAGEEYFTKERIMYYGMYFKFELYKIVLFSLNYFKHLCLKNLTILLTVSSNNGLMQYLQSYIKTGIILCLLPVSNLTKYFGKFCQIFIFSKHSLKQFS